MIIIKSGRHPLAVTLLAFCVVSGVGGVVTYGRSASTVLRTFPEPLGRIYYSVLALGSVLAIVGIFWRGFGGPRLEKSGLWMLAGLFTSYGVMAITVAGWRALFFALLLFGFALGSLLRIIQIRRELKKVIAAAVHTNATDQLE